MTRVFSNVKHDWSTHSTEHQSKIAVNGQRSDTVSDIVRSSASGCYWLINNRPVTEDDSGFVLDNRPMLVSVQRGVCTACVTVKMASSGEAG